jgi:hypothetical protein
MTVIIGLRESLRLLWTSSFAGNKAMMNAFCFYDFTRYNPGGSTIALELSRIQTPAQSTTKALSER